VLLDASKRYEKGISLEEMMFCIERKLADYHGYFVLFIDEVDNVTHDKQNFLTFLIRRLPSVSLPSSSWSWSPPAQLAEHLDRGSNPFCV